MSKILTWIKANLASILGIIQAFLKFLKEVITALINLLSIIMPASKAQAIALKARDIVNQVDAFIEKYKVYLIPAV